MNQRKVIKQNISGLSQMVRGVYFSIGSVIIFLLTLCIMSCDKDSFIYPERRTLIESVYASGKIIAGNEHLLQPMSNGIILEKLVNEGDTVKKGQLLYILKREMPVVNVQSKSNNAPIRNLESLSLRVKGAPPAEDKFFIRSDCNGLIYQANKEAGESVHMLEPLVLIGDIDDRMAWLSVDQQDVPKIKVGQLVILKSDLSGDSLFEAQVEKIYSMMNEANQSFRVDVSFKSPFSLPFIHQAVEGNIIIQRKENALVLPAYVLSEGDSVRIRTDGGPERIKVNTGIKGIDFIEITGDLDEKTPVYVNYKK